MQTNWEEKWSERMICLFSSSHTEILQGGAAAGGDARAGECLGGRDTMAAWARWYRGSFSHETALCGTAQSASEPSPPGQILGWAKLWAMPAPWPCQIVSLAKSWVRLNYGLCQAVSRAKS